MSFLCCVIASPQDGSVAAERLTLLNNLFKLSKSEDEGNSEKNTPLTGKLIREGFMVKKSRKSDDKVYGILTSEYFAYGNEVFHVTGPSTMEIRRIIPLTAALAT